MRIGIVGSEAAKFTEDTCLQARDAIQALCYEYKNELTTIISGACHLGGIDVWAIEEAKAMGFGTIEFPPKTKQWSGGYKQRNVEIAEASDLVCCITVKELPPDYKGMRFPYCYHCKTNEHIKSGGCWTAKYAKSLGKPTRIIVI